MVPLHLGVLAGGARHGQTKTEHLESAHYTHMGRRPVLDILWQSGLFLVASPFYDVMIGEIFSYTILLVVKILRTHTEYEMHLYTGLNGCSFFVGGCEVLWFEVLEFRACLLDSGKGTVITSTLLRPPPPSPLNLLPLHL